MTHLGASRENAEGVRVKRLIISSVLVAIAAICSSSWTWAASQSPQVVNDRWPHYSQDGDHIAFVSNRLGTLSPYVMLADGGDLKNVPLTLDERQHFGGVVWLSNDTLLITLYEPIRFGGYDNGGEIDTLVSAPISGGDSQTLYAGINIQRPAASPSGNWLVFEAEHGAFQANPTIDIETLDLSTLPLNVLTHHDGSYIQAAWSPDSASIAFACATGSKPLQICTMRSDGTDARVLTSGTGSHQWPAWSPDATQIAFFDESQIGGKTDSVIGVVGADGSGEHAITSHSGVVRDETPSWSPDGRSIAFQTDRMGGGFRIAVIHPDGSGLQMLTR
jgi:Tol biopolymer transport system component